MPERFWCQFLVDPYLFFEISKKQLEIYTDWHEYTHALSSTESEQKGVGYLLSPEDYLNTLKALTTRREAIEKRFDRKLKT
jgi:hypothetical protein